MLVVAEKNKSNAPRVPGESGEHSQREQNLLKRMPVHFCREGEAEKGGHAESDLKLAQTCLEPKLP